MKRYGNAIGFAFCIALLASTSVKTAEVSHWALDGNLDDSGPGGNPGTFVGAGALTFVEGFDGTANGAISFTALDESYVNLDQNTFLPVSSQPTYSIAMWIKGPVQRDARFLSEGSTATNNTLYNLGTHNTGANGAFDLFIRNDANVQTAPHRKSAATLFDDTWHHFAFVDVNGTVQVYIDGFQDPTNFNYARTPLTADSTTLGAILRTTACCFFQGALDDVHIFDHALSVQEVRDMIDPTCPDVADTSCDSLDVVGPEGGLPGIHTLTATGSDDGGDALIYSFRAESAGGAILTAGPQAESSAELSLGAGTWTLSVTVDDDEFCLDSSDDVTCSQELIIDPPPALISHWNFDGNLDDPVSENHGIFQGGEGDAVTYTEGFDGTENGAVLFDGADDLVVATQNSGLPIYLNPSFTVAMWVKGAPQADRRVFSEGSTMDNSPLFNIGSREVNAGPGVNVFLRNDTGQGTPIGHRGSDRAAFDDTWHHIAWVEDGPGNGIVYIDGVRDARSFAYNRGPLSANTTSIGGILRGGPCCLYGGAIDDVQLYNYALNPTEVRDLIPEAKTCPGDDDTNCEMLEVVGENGPVTGEFTLTATATDTSGDDILYMFTAESGDTYIQSGPSASDNAVFNLTPGDWTLTVIVDDDLFCHDATSSCVQEIEVLSEPELELARWSFDGDLLDSIGGNDGTMLGANPPRFGQGFDCADPGSVVLNGTDTMVSAAHVAELPISSRAEFSIAMWVRGAAGQRDLRIFSEASTTNGTPLFNLGTHNTGANGAFNAFIRADGATPLPHTQSTTMVFDDTWHHIVWADDNGQVVLYVDGVADATDFSYARSALSANTTTIGGILRENPSHFWTGDIDDVRLFNYAFDQDDVDAVYTEAPESCCPEEGDTHCEGLTVEGPAKGTAGIYTANATASDDSGDAITYLFTADDGAGTVLEEGPQGDSVAMFDLGIGTWTLSVSVDDDPSCPDLADDANCSREVEVLLCPVDGDTHCTGISVEGPKDNSPGTYVATASGNDDNGDDVTFTFSASSGDGDPIVVGPQAENVAELELGPGDWAISVTVDDDPECDDTAGDETCGSEVTVIEPGLGPFVRGDVDGKSERNLTDAIIIFNFLFLGGADPDCLAAADTNAQGMVNITSGIYLLNWLFNGGPQPPEPDACGRSTLKSDAGLGCETPTCSL